MSIEVSGDFAEVDVVCTVHILRTCGEVGWHAHDVAVFGFSGKNDVCPDVYAYASVMTKTNISIRNAENTRNNCNVSQTTKYEEMSCK